MDKTARGRRGAAGAFGYEHAGSDNTLQASLTRAVSRYWQFSIGVLVLTVLIGLVWVQTSIAHSGKELAATQAATLKQAVSDARARPQRAFEALRTKFHAKPTYNHLPKRDIQDPLEKAVEGYCQAKLQPLQEEMMAAHDEEKLSELAVTKAFGEGKQYAEELEKMRAAREKLDEALRKDLQAELDLKQALLEERTKKESMEEKGGSSTKEVKALEASLKGAAG